ncbi:uncharacterized protein HMPREF1541_09841 [Cyphellophora europaea CBS 101466]|uniref:Uncharacterized protein n=1 Tax=Cyphellophora europaea (strain CBS 101466) TaxID=1220924 RepID=W2S8D5_CYPE1|nr:uncharacterized protein HMPREF1541_09841 [Cyphellophora europaea CBS 101466]ETN44966.1 hypothetical protein HMPREF1541_09841 [Cyphellophora europaea CBS 101466]
MAAPTVRAKAPPYPRPVSPLDIDEIPFCPGTVVYEQWTDEAEEEAAKRAAKRRRTVRDNAESYLRGDQIFIMTAGLKGPFDGGWNNPWRTKRDFMDVEIEVPETAARHTNVRSARVPAIAETSMRKGHEPECIDLTGADDDIEFTQTLLAQQRAVTNVFKKAYNASEANRTHLTPTSARRIEDWLRTNDNFRITSERQPDIRSSPTPASREHHLPTPDSAIQRPVSAGGQNHDTQVGDWATRFSSKQDLGQASPKAAAHELSTQQTHESQNRAEAAILEQKIRSVHKLAPSTSLPGFEYRRVRKTCPKPIDAKATAVLASDAAKINVESGVDDGDAGSKSAPIAEKGTVVERLVLKPALSTETSKTTTANHLPSAQVVSTVPGPDGVSNVQSTAELLQPVKVPTDQAITQRQDSAFDAIQEPSVIQNGEDEGKVETPVRNPDTQALLGGSIKPFAISTIKKLATKQIQAKSPVTVTKVPTKPKPKTRSSKKKTSFALDPASEESQSSIKAGLKVRKTATTPTVFYAAEKSALVDGLDNPDDEAYGLDSPTMNDRNPATANDSLPSVSDMFSVPAPQKKTTSGHKGILKSRSQPFSSAPPGTTLTATGASAPGGTNGTYQSTTGSEKQDAQQPRQLDMFAIENGGTLGRRSQVFGKDLDVDVEADMEGEGDEFDLDAVVSDLGSYLGTWNVERAVEEANVGECQ